MSVGPLWQDWVERKFLQCETIDPASLKNTVAVASIWAAVFAAVAGAYTRSRFSST